MDHVVHRLRDEGDHRRCGQALVRTRLLAQNRFAKWALAPDPAAVATIRSAVGKQLGDWGLDDVGVHQLIVSELVTNAIRYARGGPIQVRRGEPDLVADRLEPNLLPSRNFSVNHFSG
ncbi:ATP-binding protein [Streptomyces longhuiensis]|uniref:ATP-binding protein n=1 Tax=Streptomyces TaxID=1883 RepID=UPI001D0A7607|nr:ATP-binding protein [Streptomyces longhuiensis]UDM04749.1 ATP-binding protein [Streptomyces longhuiensis]